MTKVLCLLDELVDHEFKNEGISIERASKLSTTPDISLEKDTSDLPPS